MKKGKGKRKGSSFEREIGRKIFMVYSVVDPSITVHDVSRSILSGGHRESLGDLSFSGKMAEHFPFAVECKFYKKVNLNVLFSTYAEAPRGSWFYKWWTQAIEGVKESGRYPMLVFKANQCEPLAMFPAKMFQKFPEKKARMQFMPRVVVRGDNKWKMLWVVSFDKFLEEFAKEGA